MGNISLTLHTKVFFGSFLKSPTQMGSLCINNSVTNISRLGTFKGQCHETFCSRFLFMNHLPPSPWNWIKGHLEFFENSRRYSQFKVHHWYQWHPRKFTTGTAGDVDIGGKLSKHDMTWHRWQITTNINDTGGKIATGVNDTGSK